MHKYNNLAAISMFILCYVICLIHSDHNHSTARTFGLANKQGNLFHIFK